MTAPIAAEDGHVREFFEPRLPKGAVGPSRFGVDRGLPDALLDLNARNGKGDTSLDSATYEVHHGDGDDYRWPNQGVGVLSVGVKCGHNALASEQPVIAIGLPTTHVRRAARRVDESDDEPIDQVDTGVGVPGNDNDACHGVIECTNGQAPSESVAWPVWQRLQRHIKRLPQLKGWSYDCRKSRVRVFRVLGLWAIATLLVGCGARIDTIMRIAADGSGTRVMVLILPAEDAEQLIGGISAVDASVERHLPEELSYSGIAVQADGALSATISMSFASTDEYLSKATALLAASGVSRPSPLFSVAKSPLVSVLRIEEEFTSAELLGWLFAGLEEDGVIASASNAWEFGDTTLEYAGQAAVMHDGRMVASLINDRGFARVTVRTDIRDASEATRAITYEMGADSDPVLYERYLADHTPEGAQLIRNGNVWAVSFSGTLDVVAAATDVALDTEGTVLAATVEPAADDPASVTLTLEDSSSCANVCAADAPPLTDVVTVALASTRKPSMSI
ncbi:hypothetical protein EDD26_0703 [Agrococcus jenensis]|uniref:Uncharacterized protein n=2 Tax=Agrococcus jenensis TaxID=46353 RepID=A0A3N2AQM3_9MICO|nr:hypothetical protein EDD26_0703 [Agrococcus jenensis]